MKTDLKDISANNDLDFYYNAENIPNQDLVFSTIEHFETGDRKGFFNPLEFLNLFWKQYSFLKENVHKPHSTAETLKALPLTPEQRHILFGFIIKWLGGYPVNNHNPHYNSTLRLIESEFLAYEDETPEKEICRKDWSRHVRIKQIEEEANKWINSNSTTSETDVEIKAPLIKLDRLTNSQIVLLFYYFFKFNGLEPRKNVDIAPLAKFMHLITGKKFTQMSNSDFYKKLQHAPSFKSDGELIKDLTAIKPLFERVQLSEVVKMIENEIETAHTEKQNNKSDI